jgi:hypothetical protein
MEDHGAVNTVRVGVWNAQWAAPGSERGRETIRLLGSLACDVLCVTEVALGLLVPRDRLGSRLRLLARR